MTTAKELMRKDYLTIGINDTLAHFIGQCQQMKTTCALVFDKDEYLGVIDKHVMVDRRINAAETKVGNVIKKRSKGKSTFFVPILEEDTDLATICKQFVASDSKMLPVMRKGKVIGVVTANHAALAVSEEYKNIPCEKLARKPIVATADMTVSQAITLISKNSIDHLPIVDDKNKLVGMVATTDLIEHPSVLQSERQQLSRARSSQTGKPAGSGRGERNSLKDLPLSNLLSSKTMCCTRPNVTIPEAVKEMHETHVSSIVLVENEKPVGILTIKDVLNDFTKKKR